MKLEELSRIVREVEPAAVLVDPSVLARIVSGDTWAVWRVPHSHCLTLDRATLHKHLDPDDLRLPKDQPLFDPVLLLERPSADQLNGPRDELLIRYWRLLFHAAAHRELDKRLSGLSPAGLRDLIEPLGGTAFEEVRTVLIQDGLLAAGADDRAVYAEFAAYFLELKHFNPALIPICFPSLPAAAVEAMIGHDLDGAALFRRTRLPSTPEPAPKTDDQSDESHDFFQNLMRQAKRAAQSGDTVLAAVLHTRAARVAPGSQTGTAREESRKDLYKLVDRLQKALELTAEDAEAWRRVLPALLDKADQGARPVEAALLYDLQRACLDHEQKIYSLDLVDWALSGGKTPIKRELAGQRFVRVPAQLRSAARRLTTARLTDADRQSLAALLRNALDQAEKQLRSNFRPILTEALRNAGMQPASLPEKAALEKTVEELLDRISSAGFLAFGDVRDAIARGQMKLPDLGPNERFRGDPLLRLDKTLTRTLDGVYRRAELYTRWLERGTALNFGTETGRWITRNITGPFGAAFLLGQFLWLMMFERSIGKHDAVGPAPNFFGGWNAQWEFHAAWAGLGFFFLLVIQSARVRGVLRSVGHLIYRVTRFAFWEIPRRIWANPWLRRLIASIPVQFALNFVVKPFILALIIVRILSIWWEIGWSIRILAFAGSVFAIQLVGRIGEAILLHLARWLIEVVRATPALLSWINDIFRDLIYVLEWVLARTEDWLRLRGTAGRMAVAVRTVAGLIWMPFAFLIRFYTIVLIEPMINPLKLPLSILFAKFIYPLLLLLPEILKADPHSFLGYSSPLVNQLADYLSEPGAWLLVMGTLWLLPDACTFLFWEMRENWRLYRANRPAAIRPVPVGNHGESIEALLQWGFHSGTVPKLFARLRAAERQAAQTDNWRDARTYRAALRGVEEAVQRFVARDFTEVLNSPESTWDGPRLKVGAVVLGTNRIRVELVPMSRDAAINAQVPAWLEWESRSSWLVARWAEPGFLASLSPEQARVFENALAYLYKRAGVEVVREQMRAELPRDAEDFEIGADGLLVWYGSRESAPLLYDLGDPVEELRPRIPGQRQPTQGPTLAADRVIFDRIRLTWPQWMEVWRSGSAASMPIFGPGERDLTLLPPRTSANGNGRAESAGYPA
ncbi:MAG TPA: hypothetical protein VN641_12425 [Urbifossiella sp.]|nr:hypothetical protein [Urbifossiella sp.]